MADKTITSLLINTIFIGLVLMGLLSSYILLVNNEGRGEIFDDFPEIEALNLNITNSVVNDNLLETANINSNLSADYNPELSISSADQSGNAIQINIQNLANIIWVSLMVLGSLVFGSVFTFLTSLIMAIILFVIVAYFIKGIRTGQT